MFYARRMPIDVITFDSTVLRDNPMRDPHQRRIPVYLPDGYGAGTERYPVVYLLAGFSGRGGAMINELMWDENIPQRLDRLIASGAIRPMIVVMPDCATRLGGSQYINSAATGRYQDHLTDELVPFIDRTYRTVAQRDARIVMGKSSGGYGATILGMRRPDLFGIVVDHSGDKYFELCYRADIPRCSAGLASFEHSVERFLAAFPHPPQERGAHWFDIVNMLAMASCYSPNQESAVGFDLPFDPYTAELKPDVWQRWLAHDPVHLADAHAGALRSLRLYFLDCGRSDEHHLQYGARIFTRRLKELAVPHTYEEFSGGHRNVAHRYDVSLRAVSAALA